MTLIDDMREGKPILVLTDGQASRQAYRLRVKYGIPYTVLVNVMGEYHGVWRGEKHWRSECRRMGAPVSRPHNVPPHLRKRVAA